MVNQKSPVRSLTHDSAESAPFAVSARFRRRARQDVRRGGKGVLAVPVVWGQSAGDREV